MKKVLCIVSVLLLHTSIFAVKENISYQDENVSEKSQEFGLAAFSFDVNGVEFFVRPSNSGERCRIETLEKIDAQNFCVIPFELSNVGDTYEFKPILIETDKKRKPFCPLVECGGTYGYVYYMKKTVQAPQANQLNIVNNAVSIETLEKKLQDKKVRIKRKREEKLAQGKKTKKKSGTKKRRKNVSKKQEKKKCSTWLDSGIFSYNSNGKQHVYESIDIKSQEHPEVSFDASINVIYKDKITKQKKLRARFKAAFAMLASAEKVDAFFTCLNSGSLSDMLTFFVDNKIFDINKKYAQEINNKKTEETIDMYTVFLEVLLDNYVKNKNLHNAILFNLAGKILHACFGGAENASDFMSTCLKVEKNHPFVRFCASIIYYYLTKIGWKHWQKATLNALKSECDNGNKIVYLAGGCDVLELLKHGIYNICVVDPFLKEQEPFYTKGWEKLIEGSVGDTIEITREKDDALILKRKKQTKKQTEWEIQSKSGDILGSLEFQRRLCTQSDFFVRRNKIEVKEVLLLSFNEAYHLGLETGDGGWGVNSTKISAKKKMFVKQLGPISLDILKNIKRFECQKNCRFISLGASPSNSENMEKK